MPGEIILDKDIWNAIHCNCSIGNNTGSWYNARDYCDNCQKADGEVNAEVSPAQTLQNTLKRRRRKTKPATICTVHCRYEIVREVAQSFGMKDCAEGWNVYWTDLSITHDRCKDMKRYQRINHFPGMLEICRKDLLARNLNRMLRLFPNDYNFYPRSWCLPTELNEVLDYCKVHRNKSLIVKPDIGCQGRGIFITKNLNDLKDLDRMICQVYISKPFLIDGYKFDLRVYVLLTHCDPLRIYVYNEGLVRFATKRYKEPNGANISNMYMHLTNYSVNKHSRAYVNDAEGGSKRRISTINHWLMDRFYNTERLWKAVDDVIVKTVIVAVPTLKHSYQTCFPNHTSTLACFEILGFDFILDSKLNPFLLEVNHSPSFHTETEIDLEVKESLLNDAFRLLNLSHNDKQRILSEDRQRIKDRLLGTADKRAAQERSEARMKDDEILMKEIFEWEGSHLGNFRQAYPSENDKKYEAFLNINTHSTLYADTHSSRAREIASKIQRDDNNVQSKPELKKYQKNVKETVTKTSPVKKTEISALSPYDPVVINEEEEEERLASLKKRETLLYNHGVLEKIYKGLKEAGRLQLEDEIRYGRNNDWSVKKDCEGDNPNSNCVKRHLQDVFRLLSKRGLFLSSQEVPLTNMLIRMSVDDEGNFYKINTLLRNTPVSSSKVSLASQSSVNIEEIENEPPIIINTEESVNKEKEEVMKNQEAVPKENEAVVKGVKITCSEAILNEEPWILISSKSCT